MNIYCDFSKIQDVLPLVEELSRKKGILYTDSKGEKEICLCMGPNEYGPETTIGWDVKSFFERSPIYEKVSFEQFWAALSNIESRKTIGPVALNGGMLNYKNHEMSRDDAKKFVDAALTLISSGHYFSFIGARFKFGCLRLTQDELKELKLELDKE